MDFAKLNPWNWFRKEDEQEKALPIQQDQLQARPSQQRDPLTGLHAEIDRIFDTAFRSFGISLPSHRPQSPGLVEDTLLKPHVDIAGSDAEYTITAELPGVDEKDIHIELRNNILKIKAEKRQEENKAGKGYYRIERRYGAFQRLLTLPEDANVEAIKAKSQNGVVTIRIPRRPSVEASTKKIPIG